MSNFMRWKTGCKAERMLEELFASGALNSDCLPKPVHDSNKEFKRYKLDNFRTHLNKMKAKYGRALVKTESKSNVEESETDPG